MGEIIKEKIQAWAFPMLIAALAFFLVQTYTTIQDINAKVDAFIIDNTALKVQMIQVDSRLQDLETYQKDNQEWIRDWLEEYQGAVEWAKKNSPEG